ncbi:PucR family transcriptional regulator [Caloranaerobacter ferrireducens]|uniref:PucR family transcriptional regulator n=1 Tax=Caloranaerobacter ferrireducens TaxID=1323370 RepID=UPI00084D8F38|nr:helix-turn-helix domain-containing protein [Caloranaerobacter ferrireducens]
MLTKLEIEQILNKISGIIGESVLLVNEADKKEISTDNVECICSFMLDGEEYYLFVKHDVELTDREKALIKIILEDISISDIKKQNEDIRSLFFEDLDEQRIKKFLKNIGIELDKDLVVAIIKSYNEAENSDIIAIINNIVDDNVIFCRLDDDLFGIIIQNTEEITEILIQIIKAIETELLQKVEIGVSSINSPLNIKKAYQEGKTALLLGRKFNIPENIYYYEKLTVYRILSQIDERMLLSIYDETLKYGIQQLSSDEIKTAMYFFECNLNISETARKLYIHRNTLIYRLDKIQKDTGFNLRIFSDALEFYLLLLIYKTLDR